MERRRIFVLGGTGFVGEETVHEAVARGLAVQVLVRSGAGAARVRAPLRAPDWLLSRLMGRVLMETLHRDVRADASALVATGFTLAYPTFREGLPPTLEALGYRRPERRPRAPLGTA